MKLHNASITETTARRQGNHRRIDDSREVVVTPGMSIQQAIELLRRRGGLKRESNYERRYGKDGAR